MVKALARAFRWKRMLDDGRYASIGEIAAAEKDRPRLCRQHPAVDSARPQNRRSDLDGQQPVGLAVSDLLKPFPLQWGQQRAR
jgi:hypothetical protein